jgi:hypothetical protein
MNLPPGKTCGDCSFYGRCKAFFGCPATNDNCDWSPSKFKQKVAIATVTASNSQAVLIDENQRLRAEVKKLTEEADHNAQRVLRQNDEIAALKGALLAHRADLHQGSSRPCPTCRRSAAALGLTGKVGDCCANVTGHPSDEQALQNLLRFGYAPGDYTGICVHCGQQMVDVDKRATCCLGCATRFASAEKKP